MLTLSLRLTLRRTAVSALVALAACGGGYSTGPTGDPNPVPAATVDATPSIAFTPSRVVLTRGGTVTFRFGATAHNVYFDNAPAGAPANITGAHSNESVTLTFGTAGTYAYDCHIHPGMSGSVVVQ